MWPLLPHVAVLTLMVVLLLADFLVYRRRVGRAVKRLQDKQELEALFPRNIIGSVYRKHPHPQDEYNQQAVSKPADISSTKRTSFGCLFPSASSSHSLRPPTLRLPGEDVLPEVDGESLRGDDDNGGCSRSDRTSGGPRFSFSAQVLSAARRDDLRQTNGSKVEQHLSKETPVLSHQDPTIAPKTPVLSHQDPTIVPKTPVLSHHDHILALKTPVLFHHQDPTLTRPQDRRLLRTSSAFAAAEQRPGTSSGVVCDPTGDLKKTASSPALFRFVNPSKCPGHTTTAANEDKAGGRSRHSAASPLSPVPANINSPDLSYPTSLPGKDMTCVHHQPEQDDIQGSGMHRLQGAESPERCPQKKVRHKKKKKHSRKTTSD